MHNTRNGEYEQGFTGKTLNPVEYIDNYSNCRYCGLSSEELEQNDEMVLAVYFGFDVRSMQDIYKTYLCQPCISKVLRTIGVQKYSEDDSANNLTNEQLLSTLLDTSSFYEHSLLIALEPAEPSNYIVFEITSEQAIQLSKYLLNSYEPVGSCIKNLFNT